MTTTARIASNQLGHSRLSWLQRLKAAATAVWTRPTKPRLHRDELSQHLQRDIGVADGTDMLGVRPEVLAQSPRL